MALFHTTAVILSTYEHVEKQMEITKELGEERIKLMISQMKPHFIRNSLATIRALIMYDPKRLMTCCMSLPITLPLTYRPWREQT